MKTNNSWQSNRGTVDNWRCPYYTICSRDSSFTDLLTLTDLLWD